jgi:STE24 endopeptidase
MRFALVTVWLAAPWRLASRLVLGLGLAISGRQPRRLLVVVAIATVVVAVVQSLHRHQLVDAGVIVAVAVCGVMCPLAEAALSRRDELAADWFATRAGYGAELASALHRLGGGDQHRRRSRLDRALARHPSIEHRLDELHDLLADRTGRPEFGADALPSGCQHNAAPVG